jgi:hypothetical protein
MTSLLIKTADFPFTAEDVRRELGFSDPRFDLLIEGGIASICIMSTRMVRAQTYAIPDGEDVERYGKPILVGEPRLRPDLRVQGLWREVTYAPDPDAVLAALARVVRWCEVQDDIHLAMMKAGVPTLRAQGYTAKDVSFVATVLEMFGDDVMEAGILPADASLERKARP